MGLATRLRELPGAALRARPGSSRSRVAKIERLPLQMEATGFVCNNGK
jgi:hypothetical protein